MGVGLELSGNGLEQVKWGQQALHFAVFIHHKKHAAGLVAHLFKQLHAGQGFGHEVGGLGMVFERSLVALRQRQQVRKADDTHDVAQAIAANGIPRMIAFDPHLIDAVHGLWRCEAGFEPLNIAARRHHGSERTVVEVENVAHHLVFVFFDEPGIHTFDQTGRDFFFGHSAAAFAVDAHEFEHALRGQRKQFDKGPRYFGQPGHGARHQPGHGLGIELADALGHQFTKNNGGEGDEGHDNGGGRDGRDRFGQAPLHEVEGQASTECGLSHDAVEHPNRGNAHLHSGQKLGGFFEQFECGVGALVTRLLHGGQAGLAARGQRQL